jgi:hypothetical protein
MLVYHFDGEAIELGLEHVAGRCTQCGSYACVELAYGIHVSRVGVASAAVPERSMARRIHSRSSSAPSIVANPE